MSTRSRIGIRLENGNIASVYCHFDGYIRGGVGEQLTKNYKTRERASEIIALGNLSSLGKSLNKKDTKAYSRDRGEQLSSLISTSTLSYERYGESSQVDYLYLYEADGWAVFKVSGRGPLWEAL